MTYEEGHLLDALIPAILPETPRSAALTNKAAVIELGAKIELATISPPVPIIHAMDSGLAPVSTALVSADRIPSAQFLAFETGGHFLLLHHAVVQQTILDFLPDQMPLEAPL
jgi:2-hydroxy-6-oxonona-2,4-dienedioate hydrolase